MRCYEIFYLTKVLASSYDVCKKLRIKICFKQYFVDIGSILLDPLMNTYVCNVMWYL